MVPSRLKLYPAGITNATICLGTPNFSIASIAGGSAASELVVAKAIETGSAIERINLFSGTRAINATGTRTQPRKTIRAT